MEMGHWTFPIEFDVNDWFGFIYRITELDSQREYIGKKQFKKLQRKKIKGRKNKKHVYSDSDWKKYTGSSKALNESIEKNGKENYTFEILSLHKTKGSLYYAEVCRQIDEDVLRATLPDGTRKYFNGNIAAVKFLPPLEHIEETQMKQQLIEQHIASK